MRVLSAFALFVLFHLSQSFAPSRRTASLRAFSLHSTVEPSNEGSVAAWQDDLDEILNVDVSCDSRKESLQRMLSKAADIAADVSTAIQEQDPTRLAPETLSYGKAFKNFQAFQNQLLTDIIPDVLTRGVPKLVDEVPKLANELSARGPDDLFRKGQAAITFATDLSQDASLLQSTREGLVNELKNVVKSTPEGLNTPSYEVLSSTDIYEVRSYAPFSVVSTALETEDDMMDPLASGKGFNALAGYIFGDNADSEKMEMTIPVITEGKTMSFVMPKPYNEAIAPAPLSDTIAISDLPKSTLATKTFSGLATEGEANRQKALLEDALLSDGLVYDSSSFKVLQYNPPQTLPWLRRNEVSFSVTINTSSVGEAADEPSEEIVNVAETLEGETSNTFDRAGAQEDDETAFFTSPDAGD